MNLFAGLPRPFLLALQAQLEAELARGGTYNRACGPSMTLGCGLIDRHNSSESHQSVPPGDGSPFTQTPVFGMGLAPRPLPRPATPSQAEPPTPPEPPSKPVTHVDGSAPGSDQCYVGDSSFSADGSRAEGSPFTPSAPAPLAPSFEGADTPGELEVGLDQTGRCPSCGVARFTMHRDGCPLMQPQPKRVWTATEDAVLLDGLCGHGLILPLLARLGRSQTDCLARFDQLVPVPQTRDAMRTALRLATEAA